MRASDVSVLARGSSVPCDCCPSSFRALRNGYLTRVRPEVLISAPCLNLLLTRRLLSSRRRERQRRFESRIGGAASRECARSSRHRSRARRRAARPPVNVAEPCSRPRRSRSSGSRLAGRVERERVPGADGGRASLSSMRPFSLRGVRRLVAHSLHLVLAGRRPILRAIQGYCATRLSRHV